MKNTIIQHAREMIPPGFRGAIFYATYWMAIATFDPFLNVHFDRLGLTGSQIGWLSMLIPLFILIIPPWISRLADRYAIRVRLLTISLLLVAGTLMLFSFPRTFFEFLPIVIIVSILRSSIGPLSDSLIARMAGKYQIDYGNMRFWGSLTFFVASLGLGYLWSLVGFSWMFFLAGLMMLPIAFSASILDETTPDTLQQDPQPAPKNASLLFFKDKTIILLALAGFLFTAALTMSGNFVGIFMISIGGNEAHVGALWGFSALFEIPAMIYASRIARRFGETSTLILSFFITAIGFFGYGFCSSPILLIVCTSIKGIGFGLMFVNFVTIIDRRAPTNLTTTYQGIMYALIWGLSPLVSSPISGFFFEQYGAFALFISCSILCVLGACLLFPTYAQIKQTSS